MHCVKRQVSEIREARLDRLTHNPIVPGTMSEMGHKRRCEGRSELPDHLGQRTKCCSAEVGRVVPIPDSCTAATAFYPIRLVGEALSEIVGEHAHLSRNSVGAFSLILSGGFWSSGTGLRRHSHLVRGLGGLAVCTLWNNEIHFAI
jgi:hypothetical protein